VIQPRPHQTRPIPAIVENSKDISSDMPTAAAEPGRIPDLLERPAHFGRIERSPGRGSKHQIAILPQVTSQQPLTGLLGHVIP